MDSMPKPSGSEKTLQQFLRAQYAQYGARWKIPAILLVIAAVVGFVLWLMTSVYIVGPGEQGVVSRFGRAVARTGPGLRLHWPAPFEWVDIVNLEMVRRIEIGFRSQPTVRVIPEESHMLTGDENTVYVQAIVQYQVKDSVQYLFRVADPDQALRDAAEVGLRSVIGHTTIEEILTVGRAKIQDSTRTLMQQLLDTYEAGLVVTEVKLQVIEPPEQVRDAFHEVVRAREDRERLINEAQGYQEDVLPKARGQAEQMVYAAEAYKAQRVIRAEGEAAKFIAVLQEYEKARDVTEQRLYIETMQRVLPQAQKIVINSGQEGNILPFLSAPGLGMRAPTGRQQEAPNHRVPP